MARKRKTSWLEYIITLFVLMQIYVTFGLSAEIRVPYDYTTITEALAVADNDDTILVAPESYSDLNESFPLRIQKAVVLMCDPNDPYSGRLRCDPDDPNSLPHLKGDGEHTVVLIESGGVTLQGFRITNGSGSEGINSMDGGGICVFVGPGETRDVNIVDCVVENNTCPSDETYDGCGGGIYCGGTYCECFTVNIENCVVRNNSIHGCGGGVFCALLSNVNMDNVQVYENTADDHGGGVFVDVFSMLSMAEVTLERNDCPGDPDKENWGGKGGGLACESLGIFTATNCLFSRNTAKHFGGGIFTRGGHLEMEDYCGERELSSHVLNSRIEKNLAKASGGGVYMSASSMLRFSETTFYWNDAWQDGGAVFVAGSTTGGGTVTFDADCVLEGNECAHHGGGIYLGSLSQGTFDSTQFTGNSSLFDGGGLYLETGTNVTLFSENFEDLPLGPPIEETSQQGTNVWTKTAPQGWTINDRGVPGFGDPDNDGVTEWAGWSFADKDWWINIAGNQNRSQFTLGTGTVAVADPDEWDDAPHAEGLFSTLLSTPTIDISGVDAGTIKVVFDSSWRPHAQQTASLIASFDGGEQSQLLLRWESGSDSPHFKPYSTNETVTFEIDNPVGARSMVLTFGLFDAGNDWWWAIDNIQISGISGGAIGILTNCLVTYNNSARGYGGGIQAEPASTLELKHCSIVGNFAPWKRSGIYADDGATVTIHDSILWRNAGGSLYSEGANVNVSTSMNEDGQDLGQGVIFCDPMYVGWGDLEEIHVDALFTGPGTGTSNDPYPDLQTALNGFNFHLANDSPCVGTASDGSNMGADTGVGSVAGNITATLFLAEGLYDIRGRSIICLQAIEGIDPTQSIIENAVFGCVEGTGVRHLTITEEEIFGGIVVRDHVTFEDCSISSNTALADGGGVYIADGNCVMADTLISGNTSPDNNGGGIFLCSQANLDMFSSNISQNRARYGGGSYFNVDSTASLMSSDITANSVVNCGGGLFVDGQVTITDVNIVNNSTNKGGNRDGGGIWIHNNGVSTILNCRFIGNSAGYRGGAIVTRGGLDIRESRFESNVSHSGGAILFWIERTGASSLLQCQFINNKATYQGGAVFVWEYTAPVFRDCEFKGNESDNRGGVGICFRRAHPTFEHCQFTANRTSTDGGAFFLYGAGSSFFNCDFQDSSSGDHGGVFYLSDSDASVFKNCSTANSASGWNGGAFCITDSAQPVFSNIQIAESRASNNGGGIAIFGTSKPRLSNVTISNCQAIYGGGVYAANQNESIFVQCEFRDNQAYELTTSADGGGAFFTENANGWFTRCTFAGNTAQDDGGGMAIAENANVDFRNTLFISNSAIDDGGGIHFTSQSHGTLTNCTLTLNRSIQGITGGGIYLETTNVLTLDSSIMYQNNPDDIRWIPNPVVNYCCMQETWPGTGNIIIDPLFEPNTFGLQDGSPCIDAGNPDPNMNDDCQPPGKGTITNDMGITGGPENCVCDLSSDPNLVGLWTFDKVIGIWTLDCSGFGHHANLVNGPNPVLGRFGKALEFDGVDDYVEAAINVSETNYAMSLWFNTTLHNGGLFSVVHGQLGASGSDRHVYLNSGNLMARIWSNEVIGTTGENYADGNWHCVVHTFGGEQGGQKLYIDGELKANGSKNSSNFHWQTAVNIGHSADTSQRFYSGELDEVHIYGRALSASDAQRLTSPK